MEILKKIFKKDATGTAAPAKAAPLSRPDDMIKVYDGYGRLLQFTREDWRTKILPGNFKQNWDKPDVLANLITDALTGGFVEEALSPARRLMELEPSSTRGVILAGAALLQLKRYQEAKELLLDASRRHEDGILLTNLAKAYSGTGEAGLVRPTLLRGLELEPNQDNGLLWYGALQREERGEGAELEAYAQLAELPRAWLPQLWIARAHLKAGRLRDAVALYEQVLGKIKPMPTPGLMQISGDLGNAGHLKELTELCAPHFDVKVHGFMVGNNLIKAYLETKDIPRARALLEKLFAEKRPDWQEHLNFWDAEIGKASSGYGPVPTDREPSVQLLLMESPLWANVQAEKDGKLPLKAEGATRILFYCGTALKAEMPSTIVKQPADIAGHLSRGWPLLLASEAYIRSDASAAVVIPWMEGGGFVLSAQPWTADHLAGAQADYVVFMHIDATKPRWEARFTLLRTRDKTEKHWSVSFEPDSPASAIRASRSELRQLIAGLDDVRLTQEFDALQMPDALLPNFVVALEQAMAISTANMPDIDAAFITAERSIFDHLLDLSVREPKNVMLRLLLANTLAAEAKRRPDIARGYRERVEKLEKESPLPDGYAEVSARVFAKAFDETGGAIH